MEERPVECSHCKKSVKVIYKEITEDSTIVTQMCSDCPVLQRKLHGSTVNEGSELLTKDSEAALFCATCDTNLEWVKTGNPLGCSDCYPVFSDLIGSDFISAKRVPERLKKTLQMRRNQPLHVGRAPLKGEGIALSERLSSLNEALNEALKKENYEQAAWLRDQIKALMEKKEEN